MFYQFKQLHLGLSTKSSPVTSNGAARDGSFSGQPNDNHETHEKVVQVPLYLRSSRWVHRSSADWSLVSLVFRATNGYFLRALRKISDLQAVAIPECANESKETMNGTGHSSSP